jgi:hypothetical protein
MANKLWGRVLAAGLLVCGLAGCAPITPSALPTVQIPATVLPTAPVPSPMATEHQVVTPAFTAVPLNSTPAEAPMTPENAQLDPWIAQARQDIANRLAIPPQQIELVDAQMVVWPDASLGCPQPGMAYAQVQQDGLRIRLRAGGQIYEYHSGGSRAPFLCENPPEK